MTADVQALASDIRRQWRIGLFKPSPALHRKGMAPVESTGPRYALDYQTNAHGEHAFGEDRLHVKTPRMEGFITMQYIRPTLEGIVADGCVAPSTMHEAADHEMRTLKQLLDAGIRTFIPREDIRAKVGRRHSSIVVTEHEEGYENLLTASQRAPEGHVARAAELLRRMHDAGVVMVDPYVGHFGYIGNELIAHGFQLRPNRFLDAPTLKAYDLIGLSLNAKGALGAHDAAAQTAEGYAPDRVVRNTAQDLAAARLSRQRGPITAAYNRFVHNLTNQQARRALQELDDALSRS